jgi:hypothetical protein
LKPGEFQRGRPEVPGTGIGTRRAAHNKTEMWPKRWPPTVGPTPSAGRRRDPHASDAT